jgi:hypothetical protein
VVVVSRLDFVGILQLAGQFGGRMDQGGKTLGADVDSLPQILQCHQGDLLFGFSTIQARMHATPIVSRKDGKYDNYSTPFFQANGIFQQFIGY